MSVEENLARIKDQISDSCQKVGRTADEVKILAVTKSWSADFVRRAYDLGLRCFGENYVQEALPKIKELSHLPNIEWHFIGQLQSNKVKSLGDQFALVQSVDRPSLVHEMERRWTHSQNVLVEVQIQAESQKAGASLKDLPGLLELIQATKHLRLQGLMVMPPAGLPGSEKRRIFEKAEHIRGEMSQYVSSPHRLTELSMGTSEDFQLAIECGATLVRLGTVLFGARRVNG